MRKQDVMDDLNAIIETDLQGERDRIASENEEMTRQIEKNNDVSDVLIAIQQRVQNLHDKIEEMKGKPRGKSAGKGETE